MPPEPLHSARSPRARRSRACASASSTSACRPRLPATPTCARNSSVEVVGPNPCGPGALVLQGTTLEEPPAQAEGVGFNSALSVGVITPATPLAPGASVDVRWRLGPGQTGSFKFLVNVEAPP